MQALITQLRTERFMKEKTEPNKIEEVAQTLEQEIEELEKQLAELNDMREGARSVSYTHLTLPTNREV